MGQLSSMRVLASLIFCLAATPSALSAPATVDEAKRLTTLFQTYMIGLPDVISVKLAGDSYDLTIDFDAALENLPYFKATKNAEIKITPIRLKLTDQGGGKWLIEQSGALSVEFKSGIEFEIAAKVEKIDYSGIFDENLGLMQSSIGTVNNISLVESMSQAGQKTNVIYSLASVNYQSQNERAADGTIKGSGKSKYAGFKQSMKLPVEATSTVPLDITINVASGSQDTYYTGIRAKEIANLIRWLFANISADSEELDKKQLEALQPLLRDALPVFSNIKTDAKYNDITVTSTYGEFGVTALTALFEMNGFVKDGLFREAFTFSGLKLPAGIIPAWGQDLITDRLVLDIQASGFDAFAPAQLLIDKMSTQLDIDQNDAFDAALLKAAMPNGTVNVTVNDYSMTGKTYDIKLDGNLIVGKDLTPVGKGTLKAKSLIELIEAVNALPADMNMSVASMALTALNSMAKKQDDGSLLWDLDGMTVGKFLINGVDYAVLANLGGGTAPAGETQETPAESTPPSDTPKE